jgi:hypothetical protein
MMADGWRDDLTEWLAPFVGLLGDCRAEGSGLKKMYGPPQPCKHFEILAAQSA